MATSTLLGIDINVVVMIYLPTYLPSLDAVVKASIVDSELVACAHIVMQ